VGEYVRIQGGRAFLDRLLAVIGVLAAFSLAQRAFPVLGGYASSTLSLILAALAIFSPGVAVALSGLPMIGWCASLNAGLGIVVALLYMGVLARGLKKWWVTAVIVAAVSLALGFSGMELVAVALMLTSAAFLSPVKGALHMLLYTLLVSIPASLSEKYGFANRGMIIVPSMGALTHSTSTDYWSLLSLDAVKDATHVLTLYGYALVEADMLLLLQIFSFVVAGYGASKLRESLRDRGYLCNILAGGLPALFISGVYAWSMGRAYGEVLPIDYYIPLAFMAPSFLAAASSLSRSLPKKTGVRVTRIDPLPSFKEVGGLYEIKRVLYETIILPLKNRALMEKYGVRLPRGILLYGPPGCGKTLLMKALAREAGIKFLYVKSSDILSKWYGESEKKLAELFSLARASAPSILFFDEIDSLARSRDSYSSDDVAPRLLSILLSEIDGLESSDGVIVVGSTNIPEVLDPALLRPGRFDQVIYVPPPDEEAREEIFRIHTRNVPLDYDVDFKTLARMTEGYSGADIEAICQEVARRVARRAISRRRGVRASMKDFLDALKTFRPSITPEMLERYEEFRRRFRRLGEGSLSSYQIVDIGEAKAAITTTFQLVLSSSSGLIQPLHGILIFGPQGCGKSSLVEETAKVLGLGIVSLDLRVAAGPEEIEEAFRRALKQAPSILLLEEITAKEWGISAALRAVYMARRSKRRILIASTSSRPGDIPQEAIIRGLFDRAIYVPPPDFEARRMAIEAEVGKYGVQIAFNLDDAAALTEGYSMRGVILVTRRAVATAMENGGVLTLDIYAQALKTLPPDLSPESFRNIEKFIEKYQGLIMGFKSI